MTARSTRGSERRRRAIAALGLSLCAAPGCAAQLGAGLTSGTPDAAPRAVTLEGRVFPGRGEGLIFGATATSVVATTPSGLKEPKVEGALIDERYFSKKYPIHLKSGAALVGYRFVAPKARLGLESALELGIGEPAFKHFETTGFYTGLNLCATIRFAGGRDDEPRYDVLGLWGDVVLGLRGGVWAAPEVSTAGTIGAATGILPEAGGQLALRLTLITDVVHGKRSVSPP